MRIRNTERNLIVLLFLTVLFLLPAGFCFGANLPVYEAQVGEKLSLDAYLGCSLACAMTWKLKDSSHLAPQKGNKYSVEMLQDGNFNTAWCEGAAGNGEGEWVEYHLKAYPGRDGTETSFWGLTVANGYSKNGKIWRENSRVRQFRVDINGKPAFYVNLKDSMKNQYVEFRKTCYMVKAGDIIRFTITKVYPGEKYSDTCISEMILKGAH